MRIWYFLAIVPLLLKIIWLSVFIVKYLTKLKKAKQNKGYFGLPVFEIISYYKLLGRLLLYKLSACKKVVRIIIKKYVYYTYFFDEQELYSSEFRNLWTLSLDLMCLVWREHLCTVRLKCWGRVWSVSAPDDGWVCNEHIHAQPFLPLTRSTAAQLSLTRGNSGLQLLSCRSHVGT